ncbi:MAG TPA: PLP-dependent aspartate aminotransferase family protein [Gammaproteobacteria bacterium]|nr:PLP-dependent aspartate aminotransferase family protein [Gammaproteobacteria bacterium]
MRKETRVTHQPTVELPPGNRPVIAPVYRTVKFTYPSIEASLSPEARAQGFEYTRDSNPTTRQLELLAAELQDRDDAIAVGSGMAAVWLGLLGNVQAGDRIVIFGESYRPTRIAVRKLLPRFRIEHSMLSIHDLEAVEEAFARPETKLVMFEAPTNPMLQVPDLAALVALAKRHGVTTMLDNTFAGLHNHGRFEIDYFVHSLTKYANGHGDALGGIVIGAAKLIKALRSQAVNLGATMDPGVAYLMLRGLRTYYLRYRCHSENALHIARFLSARPEVERVYYPGLPEDPGHALAARQMQDFGGVLSFDLRADKAQTWAFIDALQLFSTASSLGSTDSLVAPVRLYLGGDLSPEELERAGIKDSTVRLAVGIEHVDDLVADLVQAFEKVF